MPAPRVMTPAGFAHAASGGRWVSAPHLDLLNRKLMEVVAGRCSRLIVDLAPRHGKSEFISKYFPPYYLGMFPDRRVILTAYEADFAASWGRKAYNIVEEHGVRFFGVGASRNVTAASHWNLANEQGGMDTAGVGGPIVGKGANLLICDDPIKNSEEAASKTRRDATWDWFTSTAYTRVEPGGAIIVIMTRWNEDDLAGRILAAMARGGERWDVLHLPALAEENDPLGRNPGEALWPERFDREALLKIKEAIKDYYFEALYQGHPRPKEGGMFKREWFEGNVVPAAPDGLELCRYWDRAASYAKGDWTVGVLMGRSHAGIYFVIDVARGQWASGDRDKVMRHTAEDDRGRFGDVMVRAEQEPGSSGKDAARAFVSLMDGFDVNCERVTGDKEARARSFASQCQYDNVKFVGGHWVSAYVDELCLAEGTLIETGRGSVAIERVHPGDVALTRDGWKEVYRVELTNESADVTIVSAGDHTFEGTANHPVWVVGEGFLPIRQLRIGDILLCLGPDEEVESARRSSIEGSSSTAIPNPPVTPSAGISRGIGRGRAPISTGSCTRKKSVRSPTDATSITGTVTASTTSPPTSSHYAPPSTPDGTCEDDLPSSIVASDATSLSSRDPARGRPTVPSRAGTSSGPSWARSESEFVSTAGRNSRPSDPISDAARCPAASSPPGPIGSLLRPIPSLVPPAGVRSSPPDPGRFVAHAVAVSSLVIGTARRRVYNLGVVDSPEYFANGVLVHNCAFGPGCKHDDQVDGSSGAYNELAGRESRPFEAALVGERRGYSAGF